MLRRPVGFSWPKRNEFWFATKTQRVGAFYNQTKKNHEPETKKMKEDGYLRSQTERNRLTPVRRQPGKIQTIGRKKIQPEIDPTDEKREDETMR